MSRDRIRISGIEKSEKNKIKEDRGDTSVAARGASGERYRNIYIYA